MRPTDLKERSVAQTEDRLISRHPRPLSRGPSPQRQWHSQGPRIMIRPVNRRLLIGRDGSGCSGRALVGAANRKGQSDLTYEMEETVSSSHKRRRRSTQPFGLRSPDIP